MQKTVVINVVGLTSGLLGENTPFLKKWAEDAKYTQIEPLIPAVTCAVQSTYVTGKWPEEHGIVGNGWYYREDCEVKFWKQSNKLVQAPKIWDKAKEMDPDFTCSNMFWWYNMYSSVDYSCTPRPNYLADGRKIPDCYSHPATLRDTLQEKLGQFPLFHYWGPATTIKSSQWIADASIEVDKLHDPTLTLIYLPHLDYNLQRHGPDQNLVGKDLQEIDQVCQQLVTYYEARNARVVVLSEYGISKVNNPISLNRVLRENGLLSVREERGTELLDAGASKAFAVADHQVAHIYLNDATVKNKVVKLLEATHGVELVLTEEGKKKYHINHQRAGDIVAVADSNSWFTYYYWLDDKKAPDFARLVAIHDKPGYDPVEMFANPEIKLLMPTIGMKLLKKKLGFRVLMDIIPLDATLVKGSHGRISEDKSEWPVLISKEKSLIPDQPMAAKKVYDILLSHLSNG